MTPRGVNIDPPRDWKLATAAAAVVSFTAATAAVVGFSAVTTAGQNKDQDDDPPATVSSEKAIVVAHSSSSSFRCQLQIHKAKRFACVLFCAVYITSYFKGMDLVTIISSE